MEYTEYTKEKQEQIMEETALLQATFVENILRVADKIDVDRDGLLIHVTNVLGIAARVGSYQDYELPPVADVEPVIHGHIVWKRRHRGGFTKKKCIKNGGYDCDHNAVIDDRSVGEEPYCSECGKILGDCMNFCGNCGARMDGDKK